MNDGAIKTVWLDNPPVNVITEEMLSEVAREVTEPDAAARVVVIRGAGERAFSAGADIATFESKGSVLAAEIHRVANLIEQAPVPVVAAIHGFCLGGGLELALACDFRVAQENASLGVPEVRLGLLPGGGGTQRLPRLIGQNRAKWMIMSGDRIPAIKAQVWGLVEFVVDNLEEGIEQVAGTLAAQSPNALREIKELLRETRDERDDKREYDLFVRLLGSEDGREGVAAFLEKREPRWVGG
jgi:enoyl-CoA hydratase/carnithine racemase